MKRELVLALILIASFSLHSSVYKSNELGQRKGFVDSLSGKGWELEVSDNEEILYSNGEIRSRKTLYSDGCSYSSDNGEERVYIDSNGNISRRIKKSSGKEEEYNYFYDGARLIAYNYSLDGALERRVVYDQAGNALIAIDGTSRGFFLDGLYVYDGHEGSFSIDTSADGYEHGKAERDTDEKDGVLYFYSNDGRLEREISGNYEKKYSYSEDGALLSIEIANGNKKDVEIYSDSKLDKTISYENGSTIRERRTLDNGDIEEIRYMSNIPRYRIIFDKNGTRIKEVVAL